MFTDRKLFSLFSLLLAGVVGLTSLAVQGAGASERSDAVSSSPVGGPEALFDGSQGNSVPVQKSQKTSESQAQENLQGENIIEGGKPQVPSLSPDISVPVDVPKVDEPVEQVPAPVSGDGRPIPQDSGSVEPFSAVVSDVSLDADAHLERSLSLGLVEVIARGPSWQELDADGVVLRQTFEDEVFGQDDRGEWSVVDNTLIGNSLLGTASLSPRSGSVDVEFPKSLSPSSGAAINVGGRQVTFVPEGAKSSAGVVDGNSISYDGVFPETRVKYTVGGSGIKLDLIVDDKSAGNRWNFDLSTEDLGLRVASAGDIEFVDDHAAVVGSIPVGVMDDSSGSASQGKVTYELSDLGSGLWRVAVVADADWFFAECRQFPVTVDPTIKRIVKLPKSRIVKLPKPGVRVIPYSGSHVINMTKVVTPVVVPPKTVVVNKQPPAPRLLSPGGKGRVEDGEATLVVNPVKDPEGAPVLIEYQVSSKPDFGEMTAKSGWLSTASSGWSWRVPAGVLKANTPYWWRVRVSDGQNREKDAVFSGRETFSFVPSVLGFGDDKDWAVWESPGSQDDDSLRLGVNQSSGNAVVEVSGPSFKTAAQDVTTRLTYNSQARKDTPDFGLGKGWSLSVGPLESDRLPARLAVESGGVRVFQGDGNATFLPRVNDSEFYDAKYSGAVTKTGSNGTGEAAFVYNDDSGSEFEFRPDGSLLAAHGAVVGKKDKIGYVIADSKISKVEEYSAGDSEKKTGRGLDFAYESGKLKTVTEVLSSSKKRTWRFVHASSGLSEVHSPSAPLVSFAYEGGLLSRFWEGHNFCTGTKCPIGAATSITYSTSKDLPAGVAFVDNVFEPNPTDKTRLYAPWKFGWRTSGSYWSDRTTVQDPRCELAQQSYCVTTTQLDSDHHAIDVVTPKNYNRKDPKLSFHYRARYNSKGQKLWERSPKADQEHPVETLESPDAYSTVYSYDAASPLSPMTEMLSPQVAGADGKPTRYKTTYETDTSETGPWQGWQAHYWTGKKIAGRPAAIKTASTPAISTFTDTHAKLTDKDFVASYSGWFKAPKTATYWFRTGTNKAGNTDLTIDDKSVVEYQAGEENVKPLKAVSLSAGEHKIELEYQYSTGSAKPALSLEVGEAQTSLAPIQASSVKPGWNVQTALRSPEGVVTRSEYAAPYTGTASSIKVTDPKTKKTTITEKARHDEIGRVIEEVDSRGFSTSYEYDPKTGWLQNINKTLANGRVQTIQTFAYDDAGNITRETLGEGKQAVETLKTYDDADNVSREAVVADKGTYAIDYTYDASDNLLTRTQSVDGINRKIVNTYDVRSRVVTTEAAAVNSRLVGPKTSFTYDGVDNTLTETKLVAADKSAVTTMTYDADSNVASVTDPGGRTRVLEYDADDNQTGESDAVKVRSATEYDLLGRVTKETTPWGLAEAPKTASQLFRYDSDDQVVWSQSPGGGVAKSEYSPFGLTKTISPEAKTTTFEVDGNGNITTISDPAGNKTVYDYDAFDRVTKTTQPKPNSTQAAAFTTTEYDTVGRVITDTSPHTDPKTSDDYKTDYSYDKAGRLKSKTLPAPKKGAHRPVWTYLSNEAGELREISDPEGRKEKFTYHPTGLVATHTTPAATTPETFTYDLAGNLVSETDSNTGLWVSEYNLDGSVAKEIEPKIEGVETPPTTTYTYATSGELASVRDPNGNETQYRYDLAGNQRGIQNAVSTAYFEHDVENRLIKAGVHIDSDPKNDHYKRFAYTPDGNMSSWNNGIGGTTTYAYDGNDNLTKVTDPAGDESLYSYGPLNHRSTRSHKRKGQSAPTVTDTYTYTDGGELASARTADGIETKLAYDNLSRPTKVQQGTTSTAYEYNKASEITKSVNDVGTTTYTRSATTGLIDEISDTVSGGRFQYAYQPKTGLLTKRTDPNTAVHAYTWDSQSRPKSETTTHNTARKAHWQVKYDPAGRITESTNFVAGNTDEANGIHTYSYDAANRLTAWAKPNRARTTYGYDPAGNLTTTQDGSEPLATTKYDKADRPIRRTQNGKIVAEFTYSPAGSLTTLKTPESTEAYEHSPYQQLTKASITKSNKTETSTYTYDAQNRPAVQTRNSTTTTNAFEGLSHHPTKSTTDRKDTLHSYHANGTLLAVKKDQKATIPGTNHRGDITHHLAENGEPTNIINYTPWGKRYDESSQPSQKPKPAPTLDDTGDSLEQDTDEDPDEVEDITPLSYQQDPIDEITGHINMEARKYSPDLAAFTTQDPIEYLDTKTAVGLNLYAYANDNPLTNTDPDGHAPRRRRPARRARPVRRARARRHAPKRRARHAPRRKVGKSRRRSGRGRARSPLRGLMSRGARRPSFGRGPRGGGRRSQAGRRGGSRRGRSAPRGRTASSRGKRGGRLSAHERRLLGNTSRHRTKKEQREYNRAKKKFQDQQKRKNKNKKKGKGFDWGARLRGAWRGMKEGGEGGALLGTIGGAGIGCLGGPFLPISVGGGAFAGGMIGLTGGAGIGAGLGFAKKWR